MYSIPVSLSIMNTVIDEIASKYCNTISWTSWINRTHRQMGGWRTDGGHNGDGVEQSAGEAPLLIAVIIILSPVPALLLCRHVHVVGVSFQQSFGQRRPIVRMKNIEMLCDVPQLTHILITCCHHCRLDKSLMLCLKTDKQYTANQRIDDQQTRQPDCRRQERHNLAAAASNAPTLPLTTQRRVFVVIINVTILFIDTRVFSDDVFR